MNFGFRAAAVAMSLFAVSTASTQASSRPEPAFERLGPSSAVRVFFVGHSLVNVRADTDQGLVDLISQVGEFARAKGLSYQAVDHTLWGSPLSALWRGSPHTYKRDATEMVAKRVAFEREAATYDTMVLTDTIPVRHSLRGEFGPYYLRKFFCTLKRANPTARVYVYETWLNFQPDKVAHSAQQLARWRADVEAQRKLWEELADTASKPAVRTPGWLARFGITSTTDAGCTIEAPIYMVPVGSVLLRLADRLGHPKENDQFDWPNGRRIQLAEFFSNPYLDDGTGAKLLDPSKEHDDIHQSALGIYVIALTHFAVIYRRSPVGLPHPTSIGAPLARTLQCIAWETVLADARTGVAGAPEC